MGFISHLVFLAESSINRRMRSASAFERGRSSSNVITRPSTEPSKALSINSRTMPPSDAWRSMAAEYRKALATGRCFSHPFSSRRHHRRLHGVAGDASLGRDQLQNFADRNFATIPDDLHDLPLQRCRRGSVSFGHVVAFSSGAHIQRHYAYIGRHCQRLIEIILKRQFRNDPCFGWKVNRNRTGLRHCEGSVLAEPPG